MHLDFTLTDGMWFFANNYYHFVRTAYKAFLNGTTNRYIEDINHERIRLHDKLCSLWGFEKMDIKFMTDNLDKYPSFEDFFQALCQLKNSKVKRKEI